MWSATWRGAPQVPLGNLWATSACSAPLAYPVSTYTYVIVHKQSQHAAELRKMIFWALTQGQGAQFAAKLTFAKLSTVKSVLVASEKTLKTIHT